MVRVARYTYAALAWLFIVGLLVQVFFIGMGLFGGEEGFGLHVNFGWILHLVPILILVAAALARAGRANIWWAAALAVTVFVVPILPLFSRGAPMAAALHPVLALVAFWLAVEVVRRATAVASAQREAPGTQAPAPRA